jgi:signal peptidase I
VTAAEPVEERDDEPGDAGDDVDAEASGVRRARRRKSARRNRIEWVVVIVGAVVVAVLLRAFAIQAFYIPSASMEPTLEIGDRVLVNKVSYRIGELERGDVVVFERPPNAIGGTVEELIKRVIGLPGDSIEAHDGRVFIDGEAIDEPWLPAGTFTPDFALAEVPPGHVFVLGDNRGNSQASNQFGPVDNDLIIGRAFVIVWPPGRWGGL